MGSAAFDSAMAAARTSWDSLGLPPVRPEEEDLVATFKCTLPPSTTLQRIDLARRLDQTAARCGGFRPGSWGAALQQVLRDMADGARNARGASTSTARSTLTTASEVTLQVKVPLNRDGRRALWRVTKIATERAEEVQGLMNAVRDQLETFVWGPDGEPVGEQDPRNRDREDPAVWDG